MQEVQRFNKVLKSFVLSGDIILLNLLLWVFGSLWGNRSPFEFSMPLFQNMALMILCSSHYRYYFLSPDVSLYSGALS